MTRQNFNYLFYVDFVGSLLEVRCQNALRHLQVGWGWGLEGGEAGPGSGGRGDGGLGAVGPRHGGW